MAQTAPPTSRAEEGYLLLADISGYTTFMSSVGEAHGVDFTQGIPPGFELPGHLLESAVAGLRSPFEVAKFEGDAVFAVAPAGELDGMGPEMLAILGDSYRRFVATRTQADINRRSHECTACPLVRTLDLKMVLHAGPYVSQELRGQTELVGTAVNLVHRMLKSSVAAEVGHRHYLFMTDTAAERLGMADAGISHAETYDVGDVSGRVLDLEATS
jgi:class 3 adenylate cyclase